MDTAMGWLTNFVEDRCHDYRILKNDYENFWKQDNSLLGKVQKACTDFYNNVSESNAIKQERKNIAVVTRIVGAGLQAYAAVRFVFTPFSRPSLLDLGYTIAFYVFGHDLFKWAINLEANTDAVRPLRELSNESRLTVFRSDLSALDNKHGKGLLEKAQAFAFKTLGDTLSSTPNSIRKQFYSEIDEKYEWYQNQYKNMFFKDFLHWKAKESLDSLEKGMEAVYIKFVPDAQPRKKGGAKAKSG